MASAPPSLTVTRHSPPDESLGNQVGQLTLLLFGALGAMKSIRRCAAGVAAIDTTNVCVIWSHGSPTDPDCV